MIIGTGISLWRYLAQSQVDSQTQPDAERRIIYLFMHAKAGGRLDVTAFRLAMLEVAGL